MTLAHPRDASPGLLAALATPTGVVLFWIVYALAYTAVLGLLYPTIAHVDANSVDTMQGGLALAYQANNPPSWEWMLFAVQQLVGPGPVSHLVLRYALMAAIGIVMHRIVLSWSGNPAQAAAASYGLLAFYWFAWYMHEAMTHTVTLALLCLLFLATTVRWLERPSVAAALLLGLAAGLGLLAKFNFAILIGGVVLTLATDRRLRGRLVDPRLALALAVALALVLPVVAAVHGLGGDLTRMSADQLTENRPDWFARALLGAGRYVAASLLFLLPWALLGGLLLVLSARRNTAPRPAVRPIAEHFLARFNRTVIPAGFVLVTLLGVSGVTERYMFPLLLGVVLAFHVATARRIDERLLQRVFVGFGVAVAFVCLLVRVGLALTGGVPEARENKRLDPYDALAEALAERGLADAFFIANDRYEAGNLVAFLPTAHAAGLNSVRLRQPDDFPADGRCLLLFKGRFETAGPRAEPPRIPPAVAALMPPGAAVETVRVPWRPTLLGPARTGVFHLVDLGAGAEACRRTFGPAP